MPDSPHSIATKIAETYNKRDFNEADTRHQIIDEILHKVLCWPKELTKCESYINPGFADYRLKKGNNDDLFFLEAKKENVFFNLPKGFNGETISKHITVKTLLTDDNTKKAIVQVRDYCMEEGCEFAGITNGHEWIFFKTFERGKNWRNLKAFVICNNRFFSEKFTEATNYFGYTSILEGSLKSILGSISRKNREIFYPKDKIASYNQEVNSNKYARELRPLAKRFFGVIDAGESDFMDKCYVNKNDYDHAFRSFQNIIKDSLTPYLKEYGVKDLNETDSGGQIGDRIVRSLGSQNTGEVIVLFGGKGSGKSTFLKKLLYHNPPTILAENAIISIVDLLKTPKDEKTIHDTIWEKIVENIDVNRILEKDRNSLLSLFQDNYDKAKRQILYGLDDDSEIFNIKLNDLVKEWLQDKKYIAKRLVAYWKSYQKGCVIVVDNTDQFSHDIQDYCFTISQEIADELDCLVIVSMREERFHNSRIHGTLDAYQNSGFHISSPVIQSVFEKRIKYVLSILKSNDRCIAIYGKGIPGSTYNAIIKLFRIFENEFSVREDSPLSEFLMACAHGNIRLALELFRDFIKSGYINVDEMITGRGGLWILKIHQVLRPLMIPYRFFYEEDQSSIPNIYQIRSKTNGSHFTGLRILKRLSEGIDPSNPFFVSISELKDYFSEYFNMVEDFELNLDHFLKKDLVEANNRIDYYCEAVDNIKITTYGLYIYKTLSSYFTYIDLISTDCGLFNESVASDMVALSNKEYRHFTQRQAKERVYARFSKVESFIEYLIDEESKENDFFNLSPSSNFATQLKDQYYIEKDSVLQSLHKLRRG